MSNIIFQSAFYFFYNNVYIISARLLDFNIHNYVIIFLLIYLKLIKILKIIIENRI